jgi:hypothetical protein
MTVAQSARYLLGGMLLCALVIVPGCGKDKEAIIAAKMPPRFYDLEEAELAATVGITGVQYVDLGRDESVRLLVFLRKTEIFKKVVAVESPTAPGCDVVVGGVLETQGKQLIATFRIYRGGQVLAPYTFQIPWNPKGAGEEDVEGVYLSFRGVWSRLAIHLADNILKLGKKIS